MARPVARHDGDEPVVRRRGRPPLTDASGLSTRDRLLEAAADLCVERGFDSVTVGEIAERVGLTTGAIYRHFSGKVELLAEAGRRSLGLLAGRNVEGGTVPAAVALFLSADFAPTRRLLAELHLAGTRYPDLAVILADWHEEQSLRWLSEGADVAAVKAIYMLLIGCCHLEVFAGMPAPDPAVVACVQAMAAALDPDPAAAAPPVLTPLRPPARPRTRKTP